MADDSMKERSVAATIRPLLTSNNAVVAHGSRCSHFSFLIRKHKTMRSAKFSEVLRSAAARACTGEESLQSDAAMHRTALKKLARKSQSLMGARAIGYWWR